MIRESNGSELVAEGGGVAVLVRYPAAMQTVVRAKLVSRDDVIDELCIEVDSLLKFDV